jgi:hypothetical protein
VQDEQVSRLPVRLSGAEEGVHRLAALVVARERAQDCPKPTPVHSRLWRAVTRSRRLVAEGTAPTRPAHASATAFAVCACSCDCLRDCLNPARPKNGRPIASWKLVEEPADLQPLHALGHSTPLTRLGGSPYQDPWWIRD